MYDMTLYKNQWFSSRLKAQWAAFFDLAGWRWVHLPPRVYEWQPDFRVEFPCRHSECYGKHTLLVEVDPVRRDESVGLSFPFGRRYIGPPPDEDGDYDESDDNFEAIPADSSAWFGVNPSETHWEMGHGSGGGEESVLQWLGNDSLTWDLWGQAGELLSTDVFLTTEMIELGRSSNGGFSRAQCRLLGARWHGKSGWWKWPVRTRVPVAVFEKFLSLKDRHLADESAEALGFHKQPGC